MTSEDQPVTPLDDNWVPAETIQLYDSVAILAALDDDSCALQDDFFGPEREAPPLNLSHEEELWRQTLRKIALDPRGSHRLVLQGTTEMAVTLASLGEIAPHFNEVTRLVQRAVTASCLTGCRLRLPPILLTGAPGLGKSFYAKRLALALGVHLVEIMISVTNERGKITGYSKAWRGARIGECALGLLSPKSRTATPLFYLDEIEKSDPRERIFEALLTALEPENAMSWIDEYLTSVLPLRLDQAFWVATANDISAIPEPLISRMLVFEIAPPGRSQRRKVIASIYATVAQTYGNRFDHVLDEDIILLLEDYSPRLLKRLFDIAIPIALETGRWKLLRSDCEEAGDLMAGSRTAQPIGFV